jgi:prevent-host-death family protein
MKTCTLTEAKHDFGRLIKQAGKARVLVTRRGKPAAVIVGFKNEEDWLDYQLEHDPRFLRRIARARTEIGEGKFVKLEDLPD